MKMWRYLHAVVPDLNSAYRPIPPPCFGKQPGASSPLALPTRSSRRTRVRSTVAKHAAFRPIDLHCARRCPDGRSGREGCRWYVEQEDAILYLGAMIALILANFHVRAEGHFN
jgi:hypothetical protein